MTIDEPRCVRPFPLPGDPRNFEGDLVCSLRHLRLDITLDFTRRTIAGTARLTLAPIRDGLEQVRLDAREMRITAVRGPTGEALRFEHRDGSLKVGLPGGLPAGAPFDVEVAYEATPRRGLYFVSAEQAWTQGEAQDSRYWFPCFDVPSVKATTEMRVAVPSGLYALSNGALVERTSDAGRGVEVFHWRHDTPHPAYLVSLAVGPFVEVADDAPGIAIRYLVPKGEEAAARRAFGRTREMIELFGSKLGVPYPYPKYAQVVVDEFIFGGMENTTATTMHKFVLLDERAALDFTADHIVAHELAHQWFGDLVTCREWSEGWLNEGFATYFEVVDLEHHEGPEEAAFYRKAEMAAFFEEDGGRYRRAIVERTYREPMDLFDRHLYAKAGLVLHMLRRELGDDGFWRSLRRYLEDNRGGAVETTDLVRAIETTTGRGIRKFFDQWISSPGFPHLEATYTWDDDHELARLTITQKPEDPNAPRIFELDLDVFFGRGSVREKRRVHVAKGSESFAFALPFVPERVVVDPWDDTLARLELDPGRGMLLAQLRDEPEAPARARAAEALGKKHDDAGVVEALAASLAGDAFWGVQAAAAAALGEIRSARALDALAANRAAKHPKTRRAIAKALGNFRHERAAEVLHEMSRGEPSWFVTAESFRSMGKTRVPAAFERLVAGLEIGSYEETVRVGAIDGLGELRDERAIPLVTERTRPGHYSSVRVASTRALGKLGENKTPVRETLERILDDSDFRVRVAAIRALGEVGDARAIGAITRIADRDLEGRVVRAGREVVRDLTAGRKWTDELGGLRDAVDRLRKETQELRDRVVTLEARLGEGKEGSR